MVCIRKKYCFFIVALLLIFGFLAKDTIVSTCLQIYLKGYVKSCLGANFTYKDVQYSNGMWMFEHPSLTTQSSLEEGGYHFSADSLGIDVEFSWANRTIDLGVSMEMPHLEIGVGAKELKRIVSAQSQKFGLFYVNTHLEIPHGSVLVHDSILPSATPLFFSTAFNHNPYLDGTVSLWMENDQAKESTKEEKIQVSFLEKSNQFNEQFLECDVNVANVEGAFLWNFVKTIWPDWQSYELSQGKISGNVKINIPNDAPIYATGNLSVKNALLKQFQDEWQVEFPEITFDFYQPNNETKGLANQTSIETKISSLSTFTQNKGNLLLWKLLIDEGVFNIDLSKRTDFALEAHFIDAKEERHVSLNGSIQSDEKNQISVVVGINLQRDTDFIKDGHMVQFSASLSGEQWNFAEIKLSGFGKSEFDFIQRLATYYDPKWYQLEVYKGSVDANMLVYFQGWKISRIEMKQLVLNDIEFAVKSLGFFGGAKHVTGNVAFDPFVEAPLTSSIETLQTDLQISSGWMQFTSSSQNKWKGKELNARLMIRDGNFQHSSLDGEFAKLKGVVILDGSVLGPQMTVDFSGIAGDIIKVFPDSIRLGLTDHFSRDHIKISATAMKYSEGLLCKGKAYIHHLGGNTDELSFGFSLEKSTNHTWEVPFYPIVNSLDIGLSKHKTLDLSLDGMISSFSGPAEKAYRNIIQQSLLATEYAVHDGWFKGKHLSLERYIAPFIFSNNQLKLRGTGDFRGTFDQKSIVVHYHLDDVVLENDEFSFEVKKIQDETFILPKNQCEATHVFDLTQQCAFGNIPIHQGIFFEKGSGLLFTDINARLNIEDGKLHASNLETFSNGVYFVGEADINWSMPGDGVFFVDFRLDKAEGKISQVQHLFSHFDKQLFQFKFPIEGNLSLQKEDNFLRFDFTPDKTTIRSHIFGVMSDGEINCSRNDLLVRDLSCNFQYDHVKNTLGIDDIQGNLLVGSPNHFEEYFISGDKIYFTDYSKHESTFDLQLIDRSKKLIRLNGKTAFDHFDKTHEYVNVVLDTELSHLGSIQFSKFQMTLKDWYEIDSIHSRSRFHLKSLISDLSRFQHTGLPFLSKGMIKELNELKDPHGFFDVILDYDGDHSLFTYDISGLNVGIGVDSVNTFVLAGTKKEEVWSINQLQLDDISFAADILKDGELWNIHFLGASIGKSVLLGLEGGYRTSDGRLTAKINLLEINIDQLREWPKLMKWIEKWQLNGRLHLYGTVDAILDKSMKDPSIDLRMQGSFSDGQILGLIVKNIDEFSFQYSSEQGIIVHDLQTAIKAPDDDVWQVGFYLQYGSYYLKKNELLIDNLRFLVPASNLAWWSDHLQRTFSSSVTPEIADLLTHVKTVGDLEGGIRVNLLGSDVDLHLQLDDGLYGFAGKEYDLSQFVINYDSKGITISADYTYQNNIYKIMVESSDQEALKGKLTVLDVTNFKKKKDSKLVIDWERNVDFGFFINKIKGECAGLVFDVERDLNEPISSEYLYLTGKLDVDMNRAISLLEPALVSQLVNWKLGAGYALRGAFVINKQEDLLLSERFSFEGELLGQNFVFLDYEFQHLFAHLQFSPHALYINSLECSDPSGNVQIEFLNCWKGRDHNWHLSCPLFQLTEFRPSLLHSVDPSLMQPQKALIFSTIDVHDFAGTLGNKESFVGKGSLTFSNPPKRNFQSTILAIPAELLTRIGLDLAVLNPVRGTVDYQIKNGKVLFTTFKDVYSKGRLSKFYLSRSGSPSYLDFEGNLHMQIRMKQYNLIFKLAELFTVTVQGTLSKPTYSLQKQPTKY